MIKNEKILLKDIEIHDFAISKISINKRINDHHYDYLELEVSKAYANFKVKIVDLNPQIKVLDDLLIKQKELLSDLKNQRKEILHNILLNEFKIHIEKEYLENGTWSCEGSPTQYCIFNAWEDPCMDFCVFCGQPKERK